VKAIGQEGDEDVSTAWGRRPRFYESVDNGDEMLAVLDCRESRLCGGRVSARAQRLGLEGLTALLASLQVSPQHGYRKATRRIVSCTKK
jgi:hypothetical protein